MPQHAGQQLYSVRQACHGHPLLGAIFDNYTFIFLHSAICAKKSAIYEKRLELWIMWKTWIMWKRRSKLHLQAVSCNGCRSFFRRSIALGKLYNCKRTGSNQLECCEFRDFPIFSRIVIFFYLQLKQDPDRYSWSVVITIFFKCSGHNHNSTAANIDDITVLRHRCKHCRLVLCRSAGMNSDGESRRVSPELNW